jgi:hypothetical protein
MKKNGENPLGLALSADFYLLFNLAYRWDNQADDLALIRSPDTVIKAAAAKTKENRLAVDYLYMNYAGQYQDVIRSYGAANKVN